jgi:preprotein translocase subunit Sss1
MFLPLLTLGILVFPMLAVHWTGSSLELWGVKLSNNDTIIISDDMSISNRDQAIDDYLRELLSWWWVTVGLVYLLPVVLMSSTASFARDQVLWLRMTPCSARELALARLWRVMTALFLLGGIGFVVALITSYWHEISCSTAVWTVAGVLAHGLWAGGVVLVIGPLLRTPVDRALGSFCAFLTPVIAFLLYIAFEPKLPKSLQEWWPFTIPFAKLPTNSKAHILTSAAIGVVGLILSLVIQPGHWRSMNPPIQRS